MAENIDLQNEELQNALQIIQYTHRSLFLTGKAGTGKSTFLRYIAANTKKKARGAGTYGDCCHQRRRLYPT